MTKRSIRVFAAVVLAMIVPSAVAQPRVIFTRTFDDVRLRFLSTQVTTDPEARAEWGFSALIEADDARLLFDTGNLPDTVTANAKVLNVRLQGIHDVVLSHWHSDHTGGVSTVLDAVGDGGARIYVHPAIFDEKFHTKSTTEQVNVLRERRAAIEAKHGVFDLSAEPREIRPGFVLTGSIPRPHDRDQKLPDGNQMRQGSALVTDTIPDEQSLVINTRDGLIVVTGCGHAGVVNTVEYVRRLFPDRPIAALIGGFHWFASSESTIVEAGDQLRQLGVSRLVGAHCTLVEPMFTLRQHGWSREAAAVGTIGTDFFLHRSPRSVVNEIVPMPPMVAARPETARSSCHTGS
jgi:7,8-dihydropterin-6-yl-methyl-4-(beta-D-ribofuranosyl)aminobenzene 5'-phosphate synthase